MILILIIFVIFIFAFLIYKEVSFSPLTQTNIEILFKDFSGSYDKLNSKDFIGLSLHGEQFEIYRYRIKIYQKIDSTYPQANKWRNQNLTSNSIIGKWKQCPLDSQTEKLYELSLRTLRDNQSRWIKTFNMELLTSKNYYSYIYIDEEEQYFFLYCPDMQELYYIRRKGF